MNFNSKLSSNEGQVLAMLGKLTETYEYSKIITSILGNHNIGDSSEQLITNLRNRISNQPNDDRMDLDINYSSNQCGYILKKKINPKN